MDYTDNQSKRKFEFSKFIIIYALFIVTAWDIFAGIIIWKLTDTYLLSILLPLKDAILTTAIGFYYNKAKAENKIKIAKANNLEITQDMID